ncbi:MAG: hypothetical protein NVS2B5_16510 [Beijerinckiaceae bacterium]
MHGKDGKGAEPGRRGAEHFIERIGAVDHQERPARPQQGEAGANPCIESARSDDMGARLAGMRGDTHAAADKEGRVGQDEIGRFAGEPSNAAGSGGQEIGFRDESPILQPIKPNIGEGERCEIAIDLEQRHPDAGGGLQGA